LRLGTRLFLLVVLTGLLPASLVLLAGWMQLRHQIRLWTIPSVEASLDASLETNRRALDQLTRRVSMEGRALAANHGISQAAADTAVLGALLDQACHQTGLELAQYYERSGDRFRLVASRGLQGPRGPDASKLLRLPAASTAGPQRPEVVRLSEEDRDFLAVPTFLWTGADSSGAPAPQGALVLGLSLGARYYARLGEVSTGLLFYRRLEEIGTVLRTGYGLLAGLILLGCLALSVSMAARVARSVSRPVEDLVQGMEEFGRTPAQPERPREGAAERSRIPEMARLSAAFHRMRATLRSYEEKVREAERVRGAQDTARFVAHEIRNTLTPVQAALGVLDRQIERMEEEPRGRGKRALELIRAEAIRMANLAGAFSEYARFPDRRPEWIDLARQVEEQARSLVPERIRLTVVRPEGLPRVLADRDEMERLFRNLIKNSVESIPSEGNIDLGFSAEPGGESLRIDLADSGAGMDAETLRKAFQPGFTTKRDGSGLGLALVRSSLSHYGATFRIDSEPGRGTRCRVEIPAGTRGSG
jgi:nitrogen fixation/metabolism regulation signal transduction histidine kinase